MAGYRQHYIPRFLQRGFISHTVGSEFFTWVFRKDSKPYNPNIINSGVENKFYTHNNETKLDDEITEAEGRFAELINNCRKTDKIENNQFEIAGRLFAHLEIRTRHLRENFLNTTDYLLNRLLDYLNDPEIGKKLFQQNIKKNPSIIEDVLKTEMKKYNVSSELSHIYLSLLEKIVPSIVPKMAFEMQKAVPALRKLIKTGLKDPAKKGQLKALERGLWPDVKVNWYEKMTFHVQSFEDKLIPLGDSATIFNIQGERRFKPFLEKKDNLIAAILPISSHQILYCSSEDYQIDPEILKKGIIECSLEYFIAAENSRQLIEQSKNISKNSHILTEDQIETIISDLLNE